MGQPRYTVEDETVDKWLVEEMFESLTHLETDEARRVTVTDEKTGRSAEGVGADYDEACERACRKLGISPGDLDDELDADED